MAPTKVVIYKKLSSSSETELFENILKGGEPEKFFNNLLNWGRKNLKTLKSIGERKFSEGWTEPSGGLNPVVETIKECESRILIG